MGLLKRFVVVIIVLLVAYIGLITFLPTIGEIMSVADSLGTFESPVVPSWWDSGVIWSFTIFILGLVGVVILWAIIAPTRSTGLGRRRR